MHERKISLYNNEYSLAGISNSKNKPNIVCLHGWLDNSMSFVPLINELSKYSVHAIDLPGHGCSDPISASMKAYSVCHTALILSDFLKTLEAPVFLIGHSLGGGLASVIAAINPNLVLGLILLDNAAPLADNQRCVKNLKNLLQKGPKPSRLYLNKAAAIQARVKDDVDFELAQMLAQRSVRKNQDGKYFWNHDPRLKLPSMSYFNDRDIEEMIEHIRCPSLYVHTDWPYLNAERISIAQTFKNMSFKKLSGGHYAHMHQAKLLAQSIKTFINSCL